MINPKLVLTGNLEEKDTYMVLPDYSNIVLKNTTIEEIVGFENLNKDKNKNTPIAFGNWLDLVDDKKVKITIEVLD